MSSKVSENHKIYTIKEEIANGIIHGIGTGVSIAGLTVLVVLAVFFGEPIHLVSFIVYGVSLILLYLASTLYHSFQHPPTKRVFKIIDHSAIFILIAGTYTPFTILSIKGTLGWTFFFVIWGLALLGIFFKIAFIHKYKKVGLAIYILMGWLCILALPEMLAKIPRGGFYWLLAGGLFYTLGVIFYVWHKLPYHHAIWHVFVLMGSVCHYFAVLFYLIPVDMIQRACEYIQTIH
ncbi:MAG: hemolysin III family protein [Leptospiraceae bacterium]|nr:hemolysin III family protein [Leptospiraceae bacterium]MCP5500646.1 hemolysin III family protein [Leptospiraceae bacterium]